MNQLAGQLKGDVLAEGDPEYEKARLSFNLLIDRRPAVIARCVDADDVAAALALRRRTGWRSRSGEEVTIPPATARSTTTAW